jgi:hypothetical protein
MVQVTGAPSVDYGLSAMILAAASIANPNYTPTNYQTFLLTVLVMIIHACISSMPTLWIARFNSYGSTLNMIALFIVIGSSITINLTSLLTPSSYDSCICHWHNRRLPRRRLPSYAEILSFESGLVHPEWHRMARWSFSPHVSYRASRKYWPLH